MQRHSGSQLLHRCQIGEDSEDEVDITTDSENEVDDTTGVENDVDVPTALMTSSTLAHVTSPSLAVGGHYHSFVGQGPCSTITFHQLDAVLLKHLPKGCWLPHHVVHRLNHACSVWFLGASPGVKLTPCESQGVSCDTSATMARKFCTCSGCCCKVCCRYRHCCCSLQGSVPSKQTLYTLTLPVRTAQVLVTTMRPHAKPQTHPAPQRVQLLQQHMRQKHSFRQVQVLTAAIQTFRRCCSITHTSIL